MPYPEEVEEQAAVEVDMAFGDPPCEYPRRNADMAVRVDGGQDNGE